MFLRVLKCNVYSRWMWVETAYRIIRQFFETSSIKIAFSIFAILIFFVLVFVELVEFSIISMIHNRVFESTITLFVVIKLYNSRFYYPFNRLFSKGICNFKTPG